MKSFGQELDVVMISAFVWISVELSQPLEQKIKHVLIVYLKDENVSDSPTATVSLTYFDRLPLIFVAHFCVPLSFAAPYFEPLGALHNQIVWSLPPILLQLAFKNLFAITLLSVELFSHLSQCFSPPRVRDYWCSSYFFGSWTARGYTSVTRVTNLHR